MRPFILLISFIILSILPVQAQDSPVQPNAAVKRMSAVLNLRTAPSADGELIAELAGGTPLIALGRTPSNAWLRIRTLDGQEGWVASGYVDVDNGLDSLPILTENADPVTPPQTPSTETAENEAAPASVESSGGDAVVRAVALNLRAAPSLRSEVLAQLAGGAGVAVTGRSAGGDWLRVQAGELSGWVWAAYLQVNVDLAGIPITDSPVAEPAGPDFAAAPAPTGVISGITATARSIFQRGQALGNRADVFSKVGDSITVDGSMYTPIGHNVYNLGPYGVLQTTIDYFKRTQNSFAAVSAAAGPGWTTAAVLDPKFANPSLCQGGEIPLACEYRISKPAVALIMYGSNDVRFIDSATYAYNLQRIVDLSREMGVIPVLSTFPNVIGHEAGVQQFNGIVREIARVNGVPLWDYAAALAGLPGSGLSGDGLHPSQSPRGYEGAADFTGDNLNYGYVVRNLTALQVLDTLRRQVLAG